MNLITKVITFIALILSIILVVPVFSVAGAETNAADAGIGVIPEYRVALTTKVYPSENAQGLLVIEPEDYTVREVRALKASGYKVLAYLSIGSVSDEREYYHSLEPYTLGDLEDWPHEKYLDVANEAVQRWAIDRGKELINDMGFDGLWVDNIDVYEEYPSEKAFDGITKILEILDMHGYIMVNGGIVYVLQSIDCGYDVIDGITQEEVFSLVTDYDGKGEFERQEADQRVEYMEYISAALDAGMDAFLLEYTRSEGLMAEIRKYCEQKGAGYYISDDVDL